jgi:hypothetical protein
MVQGNQSTNKNCLLHFSFMKVGWAGENFPDAVYPTLVGRPMLRYEEKLENIQLKVFLGSFFTEQYRA